jgi:hypothetical protein
MEHTHYTHNNHVDGYTYNKYTDGTYTYSKYYAHPVHMSTLSRIDHTLCFKSLQRRRQICFSHCVSSTHVCWGITQTLRMYVNLLRTRVSHYARWHTHDYYAGYLKIKSAKRCKPKRPCNDHKKKRWRISWRCRRSMSMLCSVIAVAWCVCLYTCTYTYAYIYT